MSNRSVRVWLSGIAAAALLLGAGQAMAQPLTTSFTYQGELSSFSSPLNGQFDLRFRLYDASDLGTQVGSTLCAPNVTVVNGKFTVVLDFGGAFAGQQRYLEIEVRPETGLGCDPGDVLFTTLSPRQQVTATPSAQFALSAASATTAINATQLNGQPASFYASAANLTSGTLASPRLAGAYAEILNLANPLNSYSGNGSLLTGLNASNVNSGTLADARLSGNVALLSNTQTFTGIKTFSASPSFTSAGAPFAVTSQALVNNLNADLLDGRHASAFLQAVPNPLSLSGANSSAIIVGTNTSTTAFSSGISGLSTSTGFVTYGVYGESASNQGVAVQGTSTSASGGAIGVRGQVVSPDGNGVRGLASSGTGFNSGVVGESASIDGAGVRGFASATTGSTVGVSGVVTSPAGTGVQGIASAATGSATGVTGRSNSISGVGVWGLAVATTGSTRGVYGQASSIDGTGVYGTATATTGTTYGVYGSSNSPGGTGIFGFAASATGTGAGVRAAANSPDGFGVVAAAPTSSIDGRAILAYGADTTGFGVVLEARTASPTGYAALFTGPVGSRTMFNTNVGIGELSTLAPLHVTVQEQSLLPTAISNDDVIIEAADAVLGLYSSSSGNFGSAISLKELSGGTIASTWGIVRNTSLAGNLLHFTFGNSADQTVNASVLSLTPAGVVSIPGLLGAGTSTPNAKIHAKTTADTTVIIEGGNQGDGSLRLLEDAGATGGEFGGRITYDGVANDLLIGTSIGVSGGGTTYTNAITIQRGSASVAIAGTMSAAAKAFRIDHPLDPANKELWHSCVESPDMMNLYNGTVVTDASGYATITLPGYFEALNRDFRYQLTVIDEDDTTDAFIWAKVVRKIGSQASNQFTIRTARGNVEVSWMVTGIRQDAYANHARIMPEVEKAVKGTYLHPEAFGMVKPLEAGRAVGE